MQTWTMKPSWNSNVLHNVGKDTRWYSGEKWFCESFLFLMVTQARTCPPLSRRGWVSDTFAPGKACSTKIPADIFKVVEAWTLRAVFWLDFHLKWKRDHRYEAIPDFSEHGFVLAHEWLLQKTRGTSAKCVHSWDDLVHVSTPLRRNFGKKILFFQLQIVPGSTPLHSLQVGF